MDSSSFDLLKVLGTGSYGKVFLVRKSKGHGKGKLFAMKVLRKAYVESSAKMEEHTQAERNILEAIHEGPFLVHLHYAFQTNDKLHLILDYARGGELFTHHSNKGCFTEQEARFYVAELVLALEHLHELGIIYRDIKLENILLDDEGHILMTDFGLSKEQAHEKQQDEDGERTYSYVGTVEYMAPEIADRRSGDTGHTKAVDWWSLGILLYELIKGRTPFVCDDDNQVLRDIQQRELEYPADWSPALVDLLQKLLIKNPRDRLGYGPNDAQAIRGHSFFEAVNWKDLRDRKGSPPFLPVLAGELDTSNFDAEFTEQPAVLSPTDPGKLFRGFSFVAPSVLWGGTALFKPPKAASAIGEVAEDPNSFFSKYVSRRAGRPAVVARPAPGHPHCWRRCARRVPPVPTPSPASALTAEAGPKTLGSCYAHHRAPC